MKSRFTTFLFILLILFIVGCTAPETGEEQEEKKDASIDLEGKTDSYSPPKSTEVISSLDRVHGDIRYVHYAGEGKILISAEMLYLYDLETERIITEAPLDPAENERVWLIDNGYVLIQELENDSIGMTEWKPNYQGVFYNEELNKDFDFDLGQLLNEDDLFISLNQFSFNKDGTNMAYSTHLGLYVYDFELDKKTKILDLESDNFENRSNIAAIEQIGFINDGTQIAFKAQTLPTQLDQPSFDTFGIITTDGSKLSNQTFENYTCKELIAYNNWTILAEDLTNATGRLMVMENDTEITTIHTLTEKTESGIVTGSDKGAYFATFSSTDKDIVIRIYETKTGERIEEIKSTVEEEALLDRLPILKVLDDTRTIIILLGSKQEEIETELIIHQF